MKKILLVMSLFLGVLMMTACDSKKEKEEESLEPREVVEKSLESNDKVEDFRITEEYEEDDEVKIRAKVWYRDGDEGFRTFRLKEKRGKWVIVN